MNEKCLFNKSNENCNTAITVESELGLVTVYVSDEQLHNTLSQVKEALENLIVQAKELAETFGFDLEEAINKGGMMKINSNASVSENTSSVVSPATSKMRQQVIPPKSTNQKKGFSDDNMIVIESSSVDPDAPTVDSLKEAKELEKNKRSHRITTPTGRTFDVPDGVRINTADSEREFNDRMKRDAQLTKEGNPTSYSNYRTRPCPMCRGNATMSDGSVCQKCKGEAVLHIV